MQWQTILFPTCEYDVSSCAMQDNPEVVQYFQTTFLTEKYKELYIAILSQGIEPFSSYVRCMHIVF
jgi:hypothetical protein